MILADTHLLIWAAGNSPKLSAKASAAILQAGARWFSAASIWEISIKRAKGFGDFQVDPVALRNGLLSNAWGELAVTGAHGAAVLSLPPLHKDPFDRLLVAQAQIERLTLLTSDKMVAKYLGVRKV